MKQKFWGMVAAGAPGLAGAPPAAARTDEGGAARAAPARSSSKMQRALGAAPGPPPLIPPILGLSRGRLLWAPYGACELGCRVLPPAACRVSPVHPLESQEALDEVLAVVPQRGRKGTLACCAVCFLQSMALHLRVGVCVDERGFRVSVPEPFGEQGQGHAGLVEVHGP